jgi:hypothetical protein
MNFFPWFRVVKSKQATEIYVAVSSVPLFNNAVYTELEQERINGLKVVLSHHLHHGNFFLCLKVCCSSFFVFFVHPVLVPAWQTAARNTRKTYLSANIATMLCKM